MRIYPSKEAEAVTSRHKYVSIEIGYDAIVNVIKIISKGLHMLSVCH